MSRARSFDWEGVEYQSAEYYRLWRLANNNRSRAYHREYDKKMYKLHLERETARRARYRLKYPERIKANKKVQNALRSGKLIKQPCEVCGDIKSIAHHDNYNKPLEVIWLCEVHHKARHKTLAENNHQFK